jgi:uracil-DNA glycosylase
MTANTDFDLDDDQLAMLTEMGVDVSWWPRPSASNKATVESALPAVDPAASSIGIAQPAPTSSAQQAVAAPPTTQRVRVPPATTAPALPETADAPGHTPSHAALPEGIAQMDWTALQTAVHNCRACGLCAGRNNTVFGVGAQRADWMVIGEAPGEQEDLHGEPFVGPSGQLLDNMLKAIGLSRQGNDAQAVYIANTVKCRPPNNRNPHPEEMAQCAAYLQRQIALVQPKMILAMGRFAVQFLLQTPEPIGKLRGRVHAYQGVPVVVTYHPAYLLRNLPDKAKAWDDLCLALQTVQSSSATQQPN